MDHEELIAQFAGIAGIPPREARQYLAANQWNLEAAVTEFYANQEDVGGDEDDDEDDPDYESENETVSPYPQAAPGGGRRLGETAADSSHVPTPASQPSSQSKKSKAQQKKFATLGDFNSGSGGAHNSDPDDDEKQDLFAGGEKSGLAVQNPDDLKKKILQKAIQRGAPPTQKEPKAASKNFAGAARTLGGDDAPSREIPSDVRDTPRSDRVDRILHFWNDGFSIDDGDLYRTDDPRNAEILNGIRQGRAPLHIMGVKPGQEVDVEIRQHQENYVKPKKKFVPFSGEGNRLGSPTPGSPSMPGSFVSGPVSEPPPPSTKAQQVDESKPVVTLRISLGDGTRLTSRFNTTQTIADVYDFVARADPSAREFSLQTTFPTKILENQNEILGEMAEFKRGGVIVQKYL